MKLVKLLCAAGALSLAGCVTLPTVESRQVNVLWDDYSKVSGCQLIGPVTGSTGHFWDAWLLGNDTMINSSLNEMRIKVVERGGDTLYLYSPLKFENSVTMLANAYNCTNKVVAKPKSAQKLLKRGKGKSSQVEGESN
ncbi:MAG: DUF4156 domain-containing protein [Enterovibrio sp.]